MRVRLKGSGTFSPHPVTVYDGNMKVKYVIKKPEFHHIDGPQRISGGGQIRQCKTCAKEFTASQPNQKHCEGCANSRIKKKVSAFGERPIDR